MLVACSQVASGRRDNTLLLGGVDDRERHQGALLQHFRAAGAQLWALRAAPPQ